MASTYDDLAETRPRIQRDVLFTETPNGVLFHNSKGGFQVTAKTAYRFTELLVPYLDGEHQVKDICAGLDDQQRSMVVTLLRTLFDREFARDVPPIDVDALAEQVGPLDLEVFDAQVNYLDHYADDAAGRFSRFRRTPVAVLGRGPVAEQCVLGLLRNGAGTVGVHEGLADPAQTRAMELDRLAAAGCPLEVRILPADERVLGWAALCDYEVVLVAGDLAPAQLHRLETEGVPDGAVVIGAWVFGERAVVGPLLSTDTGAAWRSAVLRLGANVSASDEAALWAGVAAPGSALGAPSLSGPVAAMVGNLLAYECFRWVTGALRAESVDALVIQDLNSLDVAVEPLLPHPALAGGRQEAPEVVLPRHTDDATSSARPADHSLDDDPAVAMLNAKVSLVQIHTGVVTGFTDGPWTQTPLKVSSVRVNPTRSISREIVAVDVHHVAAARLRALEAAALVHVDYAAEIGGLLRGDALAAARIELATLDPRELSISNGTAPDDDEPAVPGRVLASGAAVLVPAGIVTVPRTRGTRRTQLTSAGAGAGGDAAAAVAHGLASALAHRALLFSLRGDTTVSRLDLDALVAGENGAGSTTDELRFLVRSAEVLGLGVELLDLGESSRSGAHVVLARSVGDAPTWTLSGGLDPLETAREALRDLLGLEQLGRETSPPSGGVPDPGDSLLGDLDPSLVPVDALGAVVGAATTWDDVVAALDRDGYDLVVVSTTSPDLAIGGIETAKVLIRARPDRG